MLYDTENNKQHCQSYDNSKYTMRSKAGNNEESIKFRRRVKQKKIR